MADLDRYHDFDADLSESSSDEPISFKLGGKTFHCVQPLPLGQILVYARNALNDPHNLELQAKQVNLLWSFVEPDEHSDLDTVVSNLTDLSVVQKIMEYLVVTESGRPTLGS